jgi:RNA polymerase sigma factor (sigma-70 family)
MWGEVEVWGETRSPVLAAPSFNDCIGTNSSTLIIDGEDDEETQAANDLCERYRPLALKIARGYRDRGVPLDDLRSAALTGLVIASRKFDPARAAFGAYAKPWIKGECTALFKQAKRDANYNTVSLDEPIQFDDHPEGGSRQDLVVGCRPEDQDAVLTEVGEIAHLRERIEAVMDTALNERERVIFESRFLADNAATLSDLGTQFSISAERVRQIGAVARKKVERAAEKVPAPRPQGEPMVRRMAIFYANTTPRHWSFEGWLDATKRRFPDATMADRIAAHRYAENLVAATAKARVFNHCCEVSGCWPKPSRQILHHRANASRLAESRGNEPLRIPRGPYGGRSVWNWGRP